MYTLQLSGFILRRLNRSYAQNGNRLASTCGQCKNSARFSGYRKRVGGWIREQSEHLVEACTRQFEFVVAQRIRRSIQVFHLYTRIWDETALKEFLRAWRRRVQRSSKHLLLSAVGVTYNWEHERISDQELNSYKEEIKSIHKLMNSTVICGKCHLRVVVDVCQPGVKYCKCTGVKFTSTSNEDTDGWQPFIERKDMLIWRREEPNTSGLFAYKVYGSFADVSAEDFLQVQIDVDYRRQWDATAQELQILESDPKYGGLRDQSTDIIYWEMIWPRLFANRDYVYQRRWVVDRDQGLVVIISKVTEHPNAPTRPGVYRVTSYWSFMVIRPYTDFHKPGIEFGLTYFDDPGVSIPSAIRAWVAMTGVPDFLIRMRQASKNYRQYKLSKQGTLERNDDYIELQKKTIPAQPQVADKENGTDERKPADRLKDDPSKTHINEADTDNSPPSEKTKKQQNIENAQDTDDSTSDKDKGFLKYFFFTKLFP